MQTSIVPVASINVTPVEYDWPLARNRAVEIDRHWRDRIKSQPQLFNGAVCMLKDWTIEGDRFVGQVFETEFKNFLWWREHDRPDRDVFDFFGTAALHASDNALMLGRMAGHTASAGYDYTPCGSPTPSDYRDGTLDIDGSLIREVLEETGIALARGQLNAGYIILDGARIVYVRPVRLAGTASRLTLEIARFIAGQSDPELDRVCFVTGKDDLKELKVPPFVRIYVEHIFG